MLAQRVAAAGSEGMSVGDMLALFDDRSAWGVLLLLSLPIALPIPAPGLSVPFGAGMALVAAQLAVGRTHPWLPAKLRNRSLSASNLATLVGGIVPTLRRLEKFVHPRQRWPAPEWMRMPVGFVCLLLAIIIALPIPLGHVLPSLAIALFALSMMERDGAALWCALVIAAVGIVAISLASAGTLTQIQHWWHH